LRAEVRAYAKAACNLAWSARALRSACSCLNLVLACIVYWRAWEISWVLSQYDPVANGIDLSLLERVSPIEWDNVVLYGQYILTGNSSAGAVPQKGPLLAYKITQYSEFRNIPSRGGEVALCLDLLECTSEY
jgi:Tn3 transposase DDE domain